MLPAPRKVKECLIEDVTNQFTSVQDRLLFGSLIYPTKRISHQVNVSRDCHHFLRQVFRHCPRRTWRDPQLKRLFVIEENEDAGIHVHFLLETPVGLSRDEFSEICRVRWSSIAVRERRAVTDWKRLNRGIRLHPDVPRTFLIKDHHIVRPPGPGPVTDSNEKPMSSTLAVVKPVDVLDGAVGYVLKWEGRTSQFESGELAVGPSSQGFVKGHSLTLCLW